METRVPQWTDSIANSTLCDYFYIFFVIFSVWAGLSLLAGIWVFSTSKMSLGMLVAVIINIILSFGISATSALFLYLICERAFNPFDINFDINLSAKNEKNRMINYYLNHKLDLSSINIQSQSSNIIIMSLNVHNFKSINLNDKPEMILKTILDICEYLNVDMCCLQEYYNTNLEIQSLNYAYIKDKKHIGLVVIYKKTLKITDISSFVLPNDKYLDQRRFGLMFNLNNKKFIITHLEIGKRYFDRTGSLLLADDLYKVIQFNHKIRINQLNRILQENPDYIIGDFNFNSLDKEYEYLTKKCNYYTGLVDYTTPFGKQVDFIFSKNPYKLFTKINFQYSDHLPIIAVL